MNLFLLHAARVALTGVSYVLLAVLMPMVPLLIALDLITKALDAVDRRLGEAG